GWSVAGIFLYGFYAAKKIDGILNKSGSERETLRIGLEYPGIEAVLEKEINVLAAKYPLVEISLTSAEKETLYKELEKGGIDFAVTGSEPENKEFSYVRKELVNSAVISERTGLPIARENENHFAFVVWKTTDNSQAKNRFLQSLKAEAC
ncbi:MAG: hypothetical protein J6036_06055, partial [Clostridia bacterium]|nr:hypothetical protein [Clostridia bacterium]